jgi:DNA-binding transcriptional ArsR family regulator
VVRLAHGSRDASEHLSHGLTIMAGLLILNPMLKYQDVDGSFKALAEPTRRAIVERLSRGPASVSDLARPFDMTLAAIVQHLQVLEESGLVRSEKVGRVRTCRIELGGLNTLTDWVAERRALIERRLDRLGEILSEAGQPARNPQTRKPQTKG